MCMYIFSIYICMCSIFISNFYMPKRASIALEMALQTGQNHYMLVSDLSLGSLQRHQVLLTSELSSSLKFSNSNLFLNGWNSCHLVISGESNIHTTKKKYHVIINYQVSTHLLCLFKDSCINSVPVISTFVGQDIMSSYSPNQIKF